MTNTLFILVPASLTVFRTVTTQRPLSWNPFTVAVLLSDSSPMTLFIKSLLYYWMVPTAFRAVVSAIGTIGRVDRRTSEVVPRGGWTFDNG